MGAVGKEDARNLNPFRNKKLRKMKSILLLLAAVAAASATRHNGTHYLTNYCSGLRILDATQIGDGVAPEMAFFDACDYCDSALFFGTWNNYPFFESRIVVVSSIELGMFVLKPDYEAIGLQ